MKNKISLICCLLFTLNGYAQLDSAKIFEASKGKWKVPVTAVTKIDTYQQRQSTDPARNNSFHMRFVSDSASAVKAVHGGLVISAAIVEGKHVVICYFGSYYVTYYGLKEAKVEAGEYIPEGKMIGFLEKDDIANDYILDLYLSSDKEDFIDPEPWFAKTGKGK